MSDLLIDPTSVKPGPSSNFLRGMAAVNIKAGQPVSRGNNNQIYLAGAKGDGPLHTVCGLALCTSAAGQPVFYATDDTQLFLSQDIKAGETVILSANLGQIAPASDSAPGMYGVVLGVGIGDGKINFRPVGSGVVNPPASS